jgi:hypothetical protein
VETPRKFIIAVINLRGVSTNKTIIYFITMQTYKELILNFITMKCDQATQSCIMYMSFKNSLIIHEET